MRFIGFILLFVASTAGAQEAELVYSDASSQACSEEAISDEERRNCIGASARMCVENTLGGVMIIGRALCTLKETEYWTSRLTLAQQNLLSSFEASDANLGTEGKTPYPKALALTEMMQSWEAYQTQTCAYETSLWGAMPSAGLAEVECALRMTGEQALYLESQPLGGM